MAVKLTSTGIQFPNGTIQTSSTVAGATGATGPTGATGATGPSGATGNPSGGISHLFDTTGTHTFTIPNGVTSLTLTGCGAGGGRPNFRTTRDNSYYCPAAGAGAGALDYIAAIPSSHNHGRVIVGAGAYGNGGSTTVSTGTSANSQSTIVTLGGGGQAYFRSNNNGIGGSSGNPSPSVPYYTAGPVTSLGWRFTGYGVGAPAAGSIRRYGVDGAAGSPGMMIVVI